jgi:hypothetical protein
MYLGALDQFTLQMQQFKNATDNEKSEEADAAYVNAQYFNYFNNIFQK